MEQTRTATVTEIAAVETTTIDTRLVLIMAIACGISVANLYYIQPMLADMGRSFAVSAGQIGFIATLSQLGYASGLLLIVPLGDSYNQRTLIVSMLVVVTMALCFMALAPTISLLAIASYVLGLTTVVPQIIVPFAANLAPEHARGRVVGTVMSGLLIGILLARTFSGMVSTHLGWRAMYWIAAGLMVMLAVVLRLLLPDDRAPKGSLSYAQLLRSLWHLLRTQPVLRETSVFGAMAFGAFSAFWVTLSFYLGSPIYHFGAEASEIAGLFGLVGVAGALAASFVGRLADRFDARYTNGLALVITLLSMILMWLAGQWMWTLIVGVILLDLGTQGNQVASQSRIYSLLPAARNRLNTIYMVLYFCGGSLGTVLGAYAWGIAGWHGVCAVGCLLLVIAIGFYVINSGRLRRAMR